MNGVLRSGLASFLACVSLRVRRNAAAWAFPRPSASASEKLANSTQSHNHIATPPINPVGASPCPANACTQSTVVKTLPTSVTNITGLCIIQRGSSFAKASTIARWYIRRVAPGSLCGVDCSSPVFCFFQNNNFAISLP